MHPYPYNADYFSSTLNRQLDFTRGLPKTTMKTIILTITLFSALGLATPIAKPVAEATAEGLPGAFNAYDRIKHAEIEKRQMCSVCYDVETRCSVGGSCYTVHC